MREPPNDHVSVIQFAQDRGKVSCYSNAPLRMTMFQPFNLPGIAGFSDGSCGGLPDLFPQFGTGHHPVLRPQQVS